MKKSMTKNIKYITAPTAPSVATPPSGELCRDANREGEHALYKSAIAEVV